MNDNLAIPEIINLPRFLDDRGNLSIIEEHINIPFKIKRTYWIYDVPGGERRGGHAYQSHRELIVALSGSFDVVLHDGAKELRFNLSRSYYGLYVPPMFWREMENFSTNALALIVADDRYDENEYIRDFEEFKQKRNA